ncbi:MAG TPA: hypothetical protein VE978_09930 [Chitinophagales bacterium]|nr:hypothetical protein [Chitinophagales bacterium]
MKSFLLLITLSSAIASAASSQNNSDSTKLHRFWINPTQIIAGQYTLAYAWKIKNGNHWLEAGVMIVIMQVKKIIVTPTQVIRAKSPERSYGVTFSM